jgi:hypothetical protein
VWRHDLSADVVWCSVACYHRRPGAGSLPRPATAPRRIRPAARLAEPDELLPRRESRPAQVAAVQAAKDGDCACHGGLRGIPVPAAGSTRTILALRVTRRVTQRQINVKIADDGSPFFSRRMTALPAIPLSNAMI